MAIYKNIADNIPDLKSKLRLAGIDKTPELFVKENFNSSLTMSFLVGVMVFLLMTKFGGNPLIAIVLFILMFLGFFTLFTKRADVAILKRQKEIDRDVLFAGRFLLVKLNSGTPLINSMIEASKSYGVASKFFKEIVQDIELGTPMEQALENAYKNTPSKKFKKILFQINNALKIGVDITSSLEATLEEIAQEQLIEIQRYGKKLNSLTMFYMLAAIVLPSLGITLFSVIASMVSISLDKQIFFIALFMLVVVQFFFLSVFRSMRPNLNI